MTPERAREIIRKFYKGDVNPFTPRIHSYGSRLNGTLIYEISSGESMDRSIKYAITVLRKDPDTGLYDREPDLSDWGYESEQEARESLNGKS